MVKRDRNHPSMVIWGMLNETPKGPVFAARRRDAAAGPRARRHPRSDAQQRRMGRLGRDHRQSGHYRVANHPFRPASLPAAAAQRGGHSHPADAQRPARSRSGSPNTASAAPLDLARLARHYEQWEKTSGEDAAIYRGFLDRFMADWQRWNLGDTFANPEDYFRQCVAWMAPLRQVGHQRHPGQSARHRPQRHRHAGSRPDRRRTDGQHLPRVEARRGRRHVRRLRAVALVPVRRAGAGLSRPQGELEAVLANEDVLAPGDYPARFQVVGPRGNGRSSTGRSWSRFPIPRASRSRRSRCRSLPRTS